MDGTITSSGETTIEHIIHPGDIFFAGIGKPKIRSYQLGTITDLVPWTISGRRETIRLYARSIRLYPPFEWDGMLLPITKYGGARKELETSFIATEINFLAIGKENILSEMEQREEEWLSFYRKLLERHS